MFTGLIESVGRIAALEPVASGSRLRITTGLAGELALGESVAVNGVCLTVTGTSGGEMHADIGPETARVTTLGSLAPGQPVNLERSMRADSRFGGHFVQGHVDGTGTVAAIREDGESHWLTIAFPAQIAGYLVPKGSIAMDGISLTVATLDEDRFDIMIIPFTWEHTNIASLRLGDRVNLEGDMVGKYVARGVELAAARISR
jgi:riboflavin synthase